MVCYTTVFNATSVNNLSFILTKIKYRIAKQVGEYSRWKMDG